jgi:hypothetical protein
MKPSEIRRIIVLRLCLSHKGERRDYYTGVIGYDVRLTSDMLLILDFCKRTAKKEES